MSIEIGHIYVKDIDNLESIIMPSIKQYIHLNIQGLKKVLLIDNKEEDLTYEDKHEITSKLKSIFLKHSINDISFYFEKDFNDKAKEIINTICPEKIKKEYFRKAKKHVFFYRSNNGKIPIYEEAEGNTKHYCQLLSLAWSLFKKQEFESDNVIILPKEYEEVEMQVNQMQIEIYGINNTYHFH